MTDALSIEALRARERPLVLDGGLATQLEAAGCALDPALWSAALLEDDPEAIERVHLANYEAGADCVVTASYQASFEGFAARGRTEREAAERLLRSVRIAERARGRALRGRIEPRPLYVAASVGPFAAVRADGSEYTGADYPDEAELCAFHARRLAILADSGADLLAVETLPTAAEARAVSTLLADHASARAWVSFCCRDGRHLSDGTPIRAAAAGLDGVPQVVAIGVNCTAPGHVAPLLEELRQVTDKPLVAYPNSGESYSSDEGGEKAWTGSSDPLAFAAAAERWFELGARLIGGCCRTDTEHVRAIRFAR